MPSGLLQDKLPAGQDRWSFSPAQYYKEIPGGLGPVWASQHETHGQTGVGPAKGWSSKWQKGSEYTTCEGWPRQLGLVTLQKERLGGISSVSTNAGEQGQFLKVEQRCSLTGPKIQGTNWKSENFNQVVCFVVFPNVRMIKQPDRLPGVVAKPSSLEISKALSNLIYLILVWADGFNSVISRGVF